HVVVDHPFVRIRSYAVDQQPDVRSVHRKGERVVVHAKPQRFHDLQNIPASQVERKPGDAAGLVAGINVNGMPGNRGGSLAVEDEILRAPGYVARPRGRAGYVDGV